MAPGVFVFPRTLYPLSHLQIASLLQLSFFTMTGVVSQGSLEKETQQDVQMYIEDLL